MAHLKKCCLEHVKRHIKVPVSLKVACAFKEFGANILKINQKFSSQWIFEYFDIHVLETRQMVF